MVLYPRCIVCIYLPVGISMISREMTVNQLKQSCTVAPAKARSNCSVSVTWVKETSVLVKLVPTLAPITIGMAVLTSSTGIKYKLEIDSI